MANKKLYFNLDTQAAILTYNKETDQKVRNDLYNKYINKSFDKLAEILIHRGKFYYAGRNVNEIKADVIWHLLEKMNNYTEEKGKAYSYFTVIAWHFLINQNNTKYHTLKKRVSIDKTDNEPGLMIPSKMDDDDIDLHMFLELFIKYLEVNLPNHFTKIRDLDIANAILEILKRRDNINNFQKKALFIYIKEMTNCKSSHITVVVNKYKKIYRNLFEKYQRDGNLQIHQTLDF